MKTRPRGEGRIVGGRGFKDTRRIGLFSESSEEHCSGVKSEWQGDIEA